VSRWVYLLPAAAFLVLAGLLFKSLVSPAPDIVPSALIDKPAPQVTLGAMDAQTPGFSSADLKAGHVTVVNYFASWCVPCRMESAQLMELSKMPGVQLYGVDYEERQPGAGRGFLNDLGNPYSRIVADDHGDAGRDWGVYGVPETYVVDGKGIIRFKLVGPLTADALTRVKQLLTLVCQGRGMQVSATLIAAQQAARDAQARFQAAHVPQKPSAGANFAAALGDFSPNAKPAMAAAPQNPAPQQSAPAARMGSLLDISV
jgi:cytochrome c biogenesis protein CcmG/thiol:disulfide interchange protein DsbE